MRQELTSSTSRIRFFSIALILLGFCILFLAFSANFIGLSNQSEFSANQISLVVIGIFILLSGLAFEIPEEFRPVVNWGMVGMAAVAVTLASDLIPVNTSLSFAVKQLMMIASLVGTLLITVGPTWAENPSLLQNWWSLLVENKVQVVRFLLVVLQLVLLIGVMDIFEIENQAVYHNIMLVAFYGFLMNFVMPMRYRLYFFATLSLLAALGILGFQNGLWLILMGLILIGISNLPIAFRWRVALLLIVGTVLMFMRAAVIPTPVPGAIWPILGSMFMFRLIIYVYDLKFSKHPVNISQTLSYFFMFPNLVFPFFPIVDFSNFRLNYFKDKDRLQTFQTGTEWIFRGLTHLLFYRIVNYYVVLSPEQVVNTSQLVQFVVSNYLLYTRVSGQFHLIVGILYLFGFNLPETNHLYFLASSFTDLWRRVNIYWKDFMQKIFFYPVYFRIKKVGAEKALLLSTVFVIFVTWLLHGYQWFWLRGSTFFVPTDMLFWTVLGVLLILNVMHETRHGRQRSLGGKQMSFRDFFGLSLRTAGVFTTISVLWSMWTSPTVREWLSLWSVAFSVEGILTLLLAFCGLVIIISLLIWYMHRRPATSLLKPRSDWQLLRPGIMHTGMIAGLFLLATPTIYNQLGPNVATFMSDITSSRLSQRDAQLLQRGYYEDLMGVDRFNADLWEIYTKQPQDWPLLQDTEAATMTGDFELIRLTPSISIPFHGATFSTNSWGMRDKEYALIPSEGTERIVILGPSYVMGSGVNDEETFDWLLEEEINQKAVDEGWSQYELLNFGVAGYSAMQELWVLENKALQFQPDVILFIAHHLEEEIAVRNLANSARKGMEIPYQYLNDLIAQAGVSVGMSQAEAERQLQPYSNEIVLWTYQQVVELANENDARPVFVYMPTPELGVPRENVSRLLEMAEEAGLTVINMNDAYDGFDLDSLIVAAWDRHPNALGHRLLADQLYEELVEIEVLPAGQ